MHSRSSCLHDCRGGRCPSLNTSAVHLRCNKYYEKNKKTPNGICAIPRACTAMLATDKQSHVFAPQCRWSGANKSEFDFRQVSEPPRRPLLTVPFQKPLRQKWGGAVTRNPPVVLQMCQRASSDGFKYLFIRAYLFVCMFSQSVTPPPPLQKLVLIQTVFP